MTETSVIDPNELTYKSVKVSWDPDRSDFIAHITFYPDISNRFETITASGPIECAYLANEGVYIQGTIYKKNTYNAGEMYFSGSEHPNLLKLIRTYIYDIADMLDAEMWTKERGGYLLIKRGLLKVMRDDDLFDRARVKGKDTEGKFIKLDGEITLVRTK